MWNVLAMIKCLSLAGIVQINTLTMVMSGGNKHDLVYLLHPDHFRRALMMLMSLPLEKKQGSEER